MAIRTLDDLDLAGTTVAVRVDINSPLTSDRSLADDARLRAHVETLDELLDGGASVVILAHQGRPGGDDFARLEPHADRLDDLLAGPVSYCESTFSADAREDVTSLDEGEAVLLENTRFYSEEYMEFDPEAAADTFLVCRLEPVLDAYVNDAFAAAHRSQPSLVGFPSVLPAYAGRVMETELDVLRSVDEKPSPRVDVVGGAKVPDSIAVAKHVLDHDLTDQVLTTGVVANVFMLAGDVDVGDASADFIHEKGYWEEVERAAGILDDHADRIRFPEDVAVKRDGERVEIPIEDLPPREGEAVKDIGHDTIAAYSDVVRNAGTVVLNGPAGVFEDDAFADGTREFFTAVAESDAYSIVGGGDSAAAIRRFGIEGFDHVSTGGGATLRLLTGEPLPAVEALKQ